MSKLVTLICGYCKKEFLRDLRHVNENIKLKQDFYCSLVCAGKAHRNRITLMCENPNCNKPFARVKTHSSLHNFCSQSCAASVNNKKFPKRIARTGKCLTCGKDFKTNSMYCSVICKNTAKRMEAKDVIEKIITFYSAHKRIPLKAEFTHTKVAQARFGSWNKAIRAAGFTPNSVKFSRKYVALDGHVCDSFAEKIIDDWLTENHISHERSVPYGFHNMTADFKINDTWIEFFGLKGQLKRYDELVKEKLKLWKRRNLHAIAIYPKDLFPKNNLGKLLLNVR